MMKLHKAILISGHTIAVVMANGLQVLRASPLRGSPYPNMALLGPLGSFEKWRYATKEDFDNFCLTWHPDYGVM